MTNYDTIKKILDIARWAPSGDNTQPWRFELIDSSHVCVHAFDTRDHCVYDLDGRPSQIAVGALLETAAIGASQFGLRMHTSRRPESPDHAPIIDLHFQEDPTISKSELLPSVEKRSVQRRPLSIRALSAQEQETLQTAVGSGYQVTWISSLKDRVRTAKLMFHSAKIRLIIPEAYRVHKEIIEWNSRYSTERVPDQALGTDSLTTKLMQSIMQSWDRVAFFNRYFAGTWAPRIQLDLIPSIACASHFVLVAEKKPSSVDDYIAAGRAMQRFWLTCTHLGLLMQPEITPLVFSQYARRNVKFSIVTKAHTIAQQVQAGLTDLVGQQAAENAVFMGRVGHGKQPLARSLRRPLESLILNGKP